MMKTLSAKIKVASFYLRSWAEQPVSPVVVVKNIRHFRAHQHDRKRCLEIGPGKGRVKGYETLDVVHGRNIDYVADVTKPLYFLDSETYDIVYASHVLEHIPWYQAMAVLSEWTRILKRKTGRLILHTPDGYKLAKLLIDIEEKRVTKTPDNWRIENDEGNLYKYVNGHLMYGASTAYPSWHKSIYTYTYLHNLLQKLGFTNIRKTKKSEILRQDHGWVNLGITGVRI